MNEGNYNQEDRVRVPQDNFESMWLNSLINENTLNSNSTVFPNETGVQFVGNPEMQCQFGYPALSDAGTSAGFPLEEVPPELQFPEVSTAEPEVVPVASLPATNNWTGDYGFDVHFERTDPATNSSSWTYSHYKDKLYVKKDAPCPIKFVTTGNIPFGTSVRATVVFSQAQFVNEIVKRCFNHTQKDVENGVVLASCLLRSECLQAVYDEDPITKRHSVIVNYENPQRGATDSTYVYSFSCWGSCAGGINRRPIKLIFTLENGGRVIGRRSIELRICACPARDRLSDEKPFTLKPECTKKVKRKLSIFEEGCEVETRKWVPSKSTHAGSGDEQGTNSSDNNVASIFNLMHGSPSKKSKTNSAPPPGPYIISVLDYGLYRFLRKMQNFYTVYGAMSNLSPYIKQFLIESRVKSESSEEKRTTTDDSD